MPKVHPSLALDSRLRRTLMFTHCCRSCLSCMVCLGPVLIISCTHFSIKGQTLNFYLEPHPTSNNIYFIRLRNQARNSEHYTGMWMTFIGLSTRHEPTDFIAAWNKFYSRLSEVQDKSQNLTTNENLISLLNEASLGRVFALKYFVMRRPRLFPIWNIKGQLSKRNRTTW